jgi:hypothetical protein
MKVTASRLRNAAWIAAVRSMNCLRVAATAFPAIRAGNLAGGVIGLSARRNKSTALLNSVPRLKWCRA